MKVQGYILALFMNMVIAILICCVIHLEKSVKAAKKEAVIAKEQYKLLESQTQVMISQIQPHFINNTLSAIYYLCGKDSSQAKKLVLDFSEYFRDNMNGIKSKEPISFEDELSHTRNYLEIEMLRYGDILNVVYDIREKDFKLPALSLQPLVENAVNHGVRSREEGGTISISSKREADKIYLIVQDDGMGFDPTSLREDDSSHVGISSIRNRLKMIKGAELHIESEIGVGTRVTMIFPKEC